MDCRGSAWFGLQEGQNEMSPEELTEDSNNSTANEVALNLIKSHKNLHTWLIRGWLNIFRIIAINHELDPKSKTNFDHKTKAVTYYVGIKDGKQ